MPFTDGWQVTLPAHAVTRPDAVATAEDLVEVVVGGTPRVLGDLVDTTGRPGSQVAAVTCDTPTGPDRAVR